MRLSRTAVTAVVALLCASSSTALPAPNFIPSFSWFRSARPQEAPVSLAAMKQQLGLEAKQAHRSDWLQAKMTQMVPAAPHPYGSKFVRQQDGLGTGVVKVVHPSGNVHVHSFEVKEVTPGMYHLQHHDIQTGKTTHIEHHISTGRETTYTTALGAKSKL